MRGGEVLLTSAQNMALVDGDGAERYHAHFPSPKQNALVKAVALTAAIASTAAMVASAARAGANTNMLGDYNAYGREADRAADMFGDIATDSFKAFNKRYKATSASEDAQFVLTQLDGGVGLVRADKATGQPTAEVVLADKKPEYVVDDFGGWLFYKAGGKKVYAYDLRAL